MWNRSLSVVLAVGLVLGAAGLGVLGASSLVGDMRTEAGPLVSGQIPGIAPASSPMMATLAITPPSVDVGQSINVVTTPSGGNPSPGYSYTYHNMPAGCTIAESQSFSCGPTQTGMFSVDVTVVDNNGNTTNSNTVSFTVDSVPTADLSVSPQFITQGQSVTVNTVVSGGSGSFSYNYLGLPPGCGQTSQMFSCTPSESRDYSIYVTVMDSNGGSNTSNTENLQVNSSSGNSGNGGSGGNNSSNPFSNLLSGFSGVLSLLLIAGIVGFATWILLIVGVWIIAIVLMRRLPKRGAATPAAAAAVTMKCANCSAAIQAGSKFCPECGTSQAPRTP